MELVQYRTLFCYANSSVPIQPCIQFLFVSSGFCVQLPSDSESLQTPLFSANSSYCKACSGLSPPSYSPCRAHIKKSRSRNSLSVIMFDQLLKLTRSFNLNNPLNGLFN